MKKVWISLCALTFTAVAFAQDSTSTSNVTVQKNAMQKNETGVIMKDGKLLMMKDGQTTQLTSDLTLDNGAIVTADGNIKSKDGTVTTLKEGEYVTMEGMLSSTKKGEKENRMKKEASR
jgi:hypothetical protein